VLDVEQPDAREHLAHVYRTLAAWGFRYHKLDFLYAGALGGLDAYRDGLRLIRDAAGPEAILVGCGAPLLPSIGLVDAMRVGPDVLPEDPDATPDLAHVIRATRARSWMNGRLWVNDPDTLVVRPELAERESWAAHLAGYGGVAFSSDRLATLDERGLELTREVLSVRARR
jgi:alpha-galactosidase